jgi:hypothetical protein
MAGMNKQTWFAVAVAVAISLPCGACIGVGVGSWAPWRGTTTGGAVTMRQFEKIAPAMSYGEVVQILGREGTDLGKRKWGPNETQTFIWSNADGSNVTCEFDNTVLFSKVQNGLK